ncbi:MAG: hypothetical protein ACD_81C00060G0004 [uncultured bacterium]|uniref:Putative 3-methyladenine DNA glycosylase n=2 Tax=Candidatus Wolfeibacteriota TaxID=1752735 RepID=A0A0G1H8H3_9BACT|nr:MAG: hypothetical protein ACD_81C00060G0004 [uncultured bacterium]KKR12733.1 MAG: hypothetical protein UT41_C0001G0277 [Candidatus Wolfebacteria bacterium GW2011_GWC2_39_22]KKT43666.1 MAG: hypothetical protein UW32_C0001G0258 [Candidatus Wolfebacteria bacterium GW2011_GWE2_44_13]HBI25606.1 3-methyladenine DNA glycosylase [Candidatus Wolfebacteria bacterium]
MTRVLQHDFLNRPAPVVAQELLGKFLIREHNGHQWTLMITEVEAYEGPEDKASRAYEGRAEHNEPMFAEAGILHTHLTYDMRWMLHIVTGPKDYPAAVLIRSALVLLPTGELEHIDGPETITQFLKIDDSFNALQAIQENGLWLEDRDIEIPAEHIEKKKRVGVDHAAEWNDIPYNFSIAVIRNTPATD